MKFLFACGGTAGHINPAIAVADELKSRFPDAECVFVGAGRDMEKRLIPAAGYRLENIKMTGFARGISPSDIKKNIGTVKNLFASGKEAKAIIKKFRPDAVIGTGGYVCYPVLTAAVKKKIPTVMHESNAVPGLTAKMLSGKVDRMLATFPNTEDNYKNPKKVSITGTPVRKGFGTLTKEEARLRLNIPDGKPLVVSFWGSLGADVMNGHMAEFIRHNIISGAVYHIHATGNGDEGVKRMHERLRGLNVESIPEWEDIRPYIDDMDTVMAAADLVLCRAGASTLAELTAMGRAAILVPSPNVTNNHQEKNARQLEKEGAAVVMSENGLTGDMLYREVMKIVTSDKEREKMERASKQMGRPDACAKIVDEVLDLIN